MPGPDLQGGFGWGAGADALTAILERELRRTALNREAELRERQLTEDSRQFDTMMPLRQAGVDIDRANSGLAREQFTFNSGRLKTGDDLNAANEIKLDEIERTITDPKQLLAFQMKRRGDISLNDITPVDPMLGHNNAVALERLRQEGQLNLERERQRGARGAIGAGFGVTPTGEPEDPLARGAIDNPAILDKLSPTEYAKVMRSILASGKDFQTLAQQKASGQVERAEAAIAELEKMSGLSGAVGQPALLSPGSWPRAWGGDSVPGSASADFEEKLAQVMALLTLPQLEFMRGLGAMSNIEFETVKAGAGALKNRRSESGFLAELQSIKKALAEAKRRNQGVIGVNKLVDDQMPPGAATFAPGGGLNQPGAALPDRRSRFREAR